MFDYLVVGAGFAGSVLAERLAAGAGKQVLLVDKRPHIGGNAYDHYDEHGHPRSTSTGRTSSTPTRARSSRTCRGSPSGARTSTASAPGSTASWCRSRSTSTPSTRCTARRSTPFELGEFFKSVAEPRAELKTSEDVIVSQVGRELYEKFFRNYTRKQWGLDPVRARRRGHRARAGADQPRRSLLHRHLSGDAAARLHADVRAHARPSEHQDPAEHRLPRGRGQRSSYDEVICTGPIDEYFDYRFGKLPYRSLQFQFETLNTEQVPAGRGGELSERLPLHARHRVQAPHRPAASEDDARLRVPAGGGRSLLPDSAAGERGALQAVPGARRPRRRACTSSAGWAPTSTTTWIRSSRRR